MFKTVSRQHEVDMRSLPGFIFLSYVFHVIGFISNLKHFLGQSRGAKLSQGER